MKLNGIDLVSYAERGDEVTFVISGTDLEAALKLPAEALVITSGEKEYVRFEGYSAASVALQGKDTVLRCVRRLDDSTAQAIRAVEQNAKTASERAEAVSAAVAELGATAGGIKEAADTTALAAGELGVKVDELAARVEKVEKAMGGH